MTDTFNLLHERWIPCVMEDGTVSELSLRDTLVQAREIRVCFNNLVSRIRQGIHCPGDNHAHLRIYRCDAEVHGKRDLAGQER